MADDAELVAMQTAAAALGALDDQARARALAWLIDRFGLSSAGLQRMQATAPSQPHESANHEIFADFYHAVSPSTDKERAVTAAFWLKGRGTAQFQSMELNSMLKDLGHGVSNITDALSAAMKEKPALVIQLKKSGSSRQARKIYKITDAGEKWVNGRVLTQGGVDG